MEMSRGRGRGRGHGRGRAQAEPSLEVQQETSGVEVIFAEQSVVGIQARSLALLREFIEEVRALRQHAPAGAAMAVPVAVPTVIPTMLEARMGLRELLALRLDTSMGRVHLSKLRIGCATWEGNLKP